MKKQKKKPDSFLLIAGFYLTVFGILETIIHNFKVIQLTKVLLGVVLIYISYKINVRRTHKK